MNGELVLAWYWHNGKLRDGSPIVPGETLRLDAPSALYENGHIGSERITDALKYAFGFAVSRVELGGELFRRHDMIAAETRCVLWTVDASLILVAWAADCVERALLRERGAGREPDPRSLEAILAARSYADNPNDENARLAHAVMDSSRNAAAQAAERKTEAAVRVAIAAERAVQVAAWVAEGAPWATWAAAEAARGAAADDSLATEREWQERGLVKLIEATKHKCRPVYEGGRNEKS